MGIETNMKRLFSFFLWLFSFWTWKDFFLRWLGSVAYHLASRETAKHLVFHLGQQESALARCLSPLPENRWECRTLDFLNALQVKAYIESNGFYAYYQMDEEANFGDFLEAIASSKIGFGEELCIQFYGSDSCQHVEAFSNALRKSSNRFRKLHLIFLNGFPIQIAEIVSSLLLKNDAIQDLRIILHMPMEMGKELVAEFVANIFVPHNLRILKSFTMQVEKLHDEGMEQLMKPFKGPLSVLEDLTFFGITSNAQLEHISGMLASSTSLKELCISKNSSVVEKSFLRGYNSIAIALGSNQSLETLSCENSSSMELKVLLEPLMPKNNHLQPNTTITKLQLDRLFLIGGKERIETLVDMLCTNTSLLELDLSYVDDNFFGHDAQEEENVLAILEALKPNKSLKNISFRGWKAIGVYKVLGAMMDLLLENHNIQDIGLYGTGLELSRDVDYVSFALSKRKKMKLQGVVQSMATANPTSGRVFLCGQPFAGKLYQHTYALQRDNSLLIVLIRFRIEVNSKHF